MNKKTITILSLIVIVILGIVIYRYSQQILVLQANKKINVIGIKLMMEEEEVKSILGEEEEYVPGFGGYRLEYPSKGISLTFLNDRDTDFYHKVNEIEVADSKYEIYGIKVGDEYEEAVDILYKQGFRLRKDDYSGYWKANMYIELEWSYDKVHKISIGVRDRVASSRHY